jgi:hypothetical protein
MKKNLRLTLLVFLCALPLTGCNFSPSVRGESSIAPTLGQQLIDLQKAEEVGAITPAQYEAKKAELLGK